MSADTAKGKTATPRKKATAAKQDANRVIVMLSDAELAMINEWADKRGLARSSAIRYMIIKGVGIESL